MSEVLNKKAIVEKVAEKLDMTKKETTCVIEALFEEIANALANGDKVEISGFGKFEVTERPARKGINPATKEQIEIAASKSPKFKASKTLKDSIK